MPGLIQIDTDRKLVVVDGTTLPFDGIEVSGNDRQGYRMIVGWDAAEEEQLTPEQSADRAEQRAKDALSAANTGQYL